MKDKGYHTQRQQESEVIPTSTTTCLPLECPCCAPSDRKPPDISRYAICLARASKPKEPVIAAPALDAAPPLAAVTLSSSEAEFVAASQAGQEVLYLRALLKGFMVLQRFEKITRIVSL